MEDLETKNVVLEERVGDLEEKHVICTHANGRSRYVESVYPTVECCGEGCFFT